METKQPTAGKFAINYGLILGAIMILISVIMYVTDMTIKGENWPNYLYYIIFPLVIIYGISQFKKQNAGLLSLGDAIKFGLVAAVISALVASIYSVIFNYIIDPEFINRAMKVAEDNLLENPNMTPEAIEMSLKWMRTFSNPFLGSALLIALSAFFGLIYSLIAGLVMKKED